MVNHCVFFDRDGVLNVDYGYPHRLQDCVLIDGAAEAVHLARSFGYKVFIVTNQGGIALGLYDEAGLAAFNAHLIGLLSGGSTDAPVIDDLEFCPHHPDAPDAASRLCDCRKPKPGMLLTLARRHNIDLSQSLMIGDRQSDVAAGEAAGCKSYLFSGGRLDDFIRPLLANGGIND